MKRRGRFLVGLALVAGTCLLPQVASADACIVTDTYNHSTDIPIAGTYSTKTQAADTSKTLDRKASTLSVFGNWLLSLYKVGLVFVVR